MNTTASPSLPGWLVETTEVLTARRRIVVAAGVGLTLLGAIIALLAPSLLPPQPVVGAAVGLAAVLLATALGLAVDAADLVVRGARHVTAAGGEVAARVGREPGDIGPLLALVARYADAGRVRVALTPASRAAGVPGARATALAEALARTGRRVLVADLTRSGTPAAGLSDVIAGDRRLADVVRFEQEMFLARVPVGSDPEAAVAGLPGWVGNLPSDLEVLVVALPPLAEPGVLSAAGATDVTLVQVEVDRTERVDLIAALDAIDAAGLTSELVLVDPSRSGAPATGAGVGDEDVAGVLQEDVEATAGDQDEPAFHDADHDDAVRATAAAAADVAGPDETIVGEPRVEEPEPVTSDESTVAADDAEAPVPVDDVSDDDTQDIPVVPTAGAPATAGAAPGDSERRLDDIWGPDGSERNEEESAAPVADESGAQRSDGAADGAVSEEAEPAAAPTSTGAPEAAGIDGDQHESDETEGGAEERGDAEQGPAPEPESDPEPVRPSPEPSPPPPAEDVDPAAQEVARRTAALQALAQEVWRREQTTVESGVDA